MIESKIVVVTGSSSGMGEEIVAKFLTEQEYLVVGIDILPESARISAHPGHARYRHYIADVTIPSQLPDISNVNILVNNAGVQGTTRDIEVNLKGVMNCTKQS